MKTTNKNFESNDKVESDTGRKTVTTTVEETIITSEKTDDSTAKKQKLDNENILKSEFDLSARKYIDWIDNIERILDEKPTSQVEFHKRQDIIRVDIS